MAGIRKKPIHPFVQRRMDAHGLASVAEYARFYGIDTSLAYQQANGEIDALGMIRHMEGAKSLGVEFEEYLKEFSEAS